MESIRIKAFAKVNLCLDVKGLIEGGYHEVEMILQQISLHDEIDLTWEDDPASDKVEISLTVSRDDVPADGTNLAWKAAEEMAAEAGDIRGRLSIHIDKNIPMAAGLAGGSSDCGAVIHGLNILWDLDMNIEQLCRIGARLGSDVPFCIMGQAAADPILKEIFRDDPGAAHCAIAQGRGTDLEPITGLSSHILLAKPDIPVSTREVYEGIDRVEIEARPDIDEMRLGLEKKDMELIEKNMVNVLENFTLKGYPMVVYTKNKVQNTWNGPVLMSGSGPTIYCLCNSEDEAASICEAVREPDIRCFCTDTTS